MILLLSSMTILLLMDVPIAVAMGLSSLCYLLIQTDIPLMVVPQTMYNGTESFILLAIPLFIFAGKLMDRGGLSQKIVNFASSLVGFIKGGLAMVSVLAAMFFSGISGSANADTAAISSLTIPAMKKKNYHPGFAASLLSSAGSIGVILPPSIPMVVFAALTNVSVSKMFLGGVIPGILCGVALMVFSYIVARRENLPRESRFELKNVWISFKEAIFALGMPFIILGGIFSGMFTATESAAIAVLYGFVLGTFVYRKIKIRDIMEIAKETAMMTAIPMFVVATSATFVWVMSEQKATESLLSSLLMLTDNPYVVLMLMNIALLILGTFLDALPAIVLSAPFIVEIAAQYHIDPVFLGVITVFNMAIGFGTPPVGVTLFISCSVAEIKLPDTYKYLWWALGAMTVVLLLITYIPGLVMYLPNLIAK